MRSRLGFDSLLTILAFTCVWSLLSWGERLSDKLLTRVRLGMSLAELQGLLGKSQTSHSCERFWMDVTCIGMRFYSRSDWEPEYWMLPTPEMKKMCNELGTNHDHFWFGRDRLLWVVVNRAGVVTDKAVTPLHRQGGGFLNWLLRRFKELGS